MAQANKLVVGKPSDDPSAKAMQAASSMLLSQMQALNAGVLSCMNSWERLLGDPSSDDAGDLDYYFRSAIELSEVSARTGEALARMKSETRQHISVERLAPLSGPARIEETLSTRGALKTKKKWKHDATLTGGGG
jgi:hypothetical protein